LIVKLLVQSVERRNSLFMQDPMPNKFDGPMGSTERPTTERDHFGRMPSIAGKERERRDA